MSARISFGVACDTDNDSRVDAGLLQQVYIRLGVTVADRIVRSSVVVLNQRAVSGMRQIAVSALRTVFHNRRIVCDLIDQLVVDILSDYFLALGQIDVCQELVCRVVELRHHLFEVW